MSQLSNISVHLVVADTALTKIADPAPEARTGPAPKAESNTTNCYIVLTANKPFEIFIHISAELVFLSDVLLFKISKDGKFVKQEWRPPHTSDDGTKQPVDAWIGATDFSFPHVVLDTNTNAPGDVDMWQDKEVVVQISHARMVEEASVDAFGNRNPGKVEPLADSDSCLTFTFKYRPQKVLESILFPPIPRSPGTAPSARPEAEGHPADVAWNRDISDPDTKENLLWCTCRLIRPRQPMVTCDNDDCAVRTFHFGCVGLDSEPMDKVWLCPSCRKLPDESVRVGGDTDEFGPFRQEWIGRDDWY